MRVGNHPELVVFHILHKKFYHIFDRDVILGFGPNGVSQSNPKDKRSGGIAHRFFVEIFWDQILHRLIELIKKPNLRPYHCIIVAIKIASRALTIIKSDSTGRNTLLNPYRHLRGEQRRHATR